MKLRAGIVGLGVMGANHMRVLSTLADVELVAVADPRREFIITQSELEVVNSVDDLIKLGVDYCVISAPTVFHEEIALKLIESGIHILIEKPISHSFESAIRIYEAAKSNGVHGAVGHIERYNSALQEARRRIKLGEIGDVYQIATRRQGPFPSRISDVGVVKDLASHDIDLTSWLGDSPYTKLSAHAAFRSGREFEDLISVTGSLENGIVINHIVNWLSPLKERKTIITGELGTFVVDTLRADLTFYENGIIPISQPELAHFRGVSQGDVHIFSFDKPEPLKVEHENFRDHLLGRASEVVSLQDGSETIRIAESIIRSYKESKEISL